VDSLHVYKMNLAGHRNISILDKTNVSCLDRKFIPFHKMGEASDGLKYHYKTQVLRH
jgi:hypothetical protein